MQLTEQCVLEHAVWLDLVEGCLKQALLLKLVVIVVIVINRAKLLRLEKLANGDIREG